MARIPRSFIDDLLGRCEIVEVISPRLKLIRRGHEWVALCPFHTEKSPSFSVSPNKQFYHCFGCGAHGNAIDFLMHYDNLDFVEAVEALAAELGLSVPREQGRELSDRQRDERESLYQIMQQAGEHYRSQLRAHPHAIDYLKRRGLDGATAARYAIGYAPDSWDDLLQRLGGGSAANQALMQRAGLLIERDAGGRYDRFRDRIMFPIRDRRGRIIAFGGRILDKGEPKYLNSPETPLFKKGEELYGLFDARQSGTRLDRLVVVEGYMDVVSLAQFGINESVATLGTAVTSEQLQKLLRLVPELVFCFDGDAAGRRAAWRAVEAAIPVLRDDRRISFLFLPEGEDPDSYVRAQGSDRFRELMSSAHPFASFFIEGLEQAVGRGNRVQLADRALALLSRMGDSLTRDQLLADLASRTQLRSDQLERRLKRPNEPSATTPRPLRVTPMRKAIALLLEEPALAQLLFENGARIDLDAIGNLDGGALLTELLELSRTQPHLPAAALLGHFAERPELNVLQRLATAELAEHSSEMRRQVFIDTLTRLSISAKQQRIEALLARSQQAPLESAERDELKQLLAQR